jgi:UDP-N-acetylmuramoyl-tripeptide--D-alanyl-D-alanine ligase
MGEIAQKLADNVIVTDDNPRTENPDTIRSEILVACPKAKEIGDRAKAIEEATNVLKTGDVLLIAGKGHETGQKIAGKIIPFDDRLHAKYAVEMADFGKSEVKSLSNKPIWTSEEVAHATSGTTSGKWEAYGVSIDSRDVKKGDIYFALVTKDRDGRVYAKHAIDAGAVCIVTDKMLADIDEGKQLIVCDTDYALEELAKESRARSNPKVIAISGKLGKSATKRMLHTAISAQAPVYAEENVANKPVNIPLAMARMPKDCEYIILEMAMGETGLLKELSALARPDITIIPNAGIPACEKMKTNEDVTNANAEVFSGMPANGIIILNRDDDQFERLTYFAKICGIRDMVSFGEKENSFVKLINYKPEDMKSVVRFETMEKKYQFEMNVTGRYWAENSMAVIAALHALNLDIDKSIRALASMQAPKGKGEHIVVPFAGGQVQIIDASYGASVSSMNAAIKTLSSIRPKGQGRHIAVLGDIEGLGKVSRHQHIEFAEKIQNSKIEKVFVTGANMTAMYNRLPSELKGGCAKDAQNLADLVLENIRSGDVICVKGSLENKMSIIVDAIKQAGQKKKMSKTVLF